MIASCRWSLFVSWCLVLLGQLSMSATGAEVLRVGPFDVDASPPIGSPMAYDLTKGVEVPLSCRGIVITGIPRPIVLCAIDWIGISNGGQTVFREALATAAGTDPSRVVVHTLHQHDAPRCDFDADEMLSAQGLNSAGFDPIFARDVVQRAAAAVKEAVRRAQPVTHVRLGSGSVDEVASNRRILGPDGKVLHTRYTATKDPKVRDFPAGTIDPELKMIGFWNAHTPVAVLTYYATHPQSYYRTGLANPDFPGLARNLRQHETGIPHIHFNGAGGNIGAGKWNDGSPENRMVLAKRVATGMERAWDAAREFRISASDVDWETIPVLLPLADHSNKADLMAKVNDSNANPRDRFYAAVNLVWQRRCQAGEPILVGCLKLGDARVLYMPGELFVEYQLAAQAMRPDLFVAMAAYGEYAPGYIGTEIAYSQGGYETSERASRVSPDVERVLMEAMRKMLD